VRKFSGFIVLLLLSVVLVACGAGDEEPEATEAPTEVFESEPTSEVNADVRGTPLTATAPAASPTSVIGASPEAAAATPAVGSPMDAATPDASPAATPIPGVATGTSASPVASPIATPVGGGTPEASPVADSGAGSMAPPVGAVQSPAMIEVSGQVVLNGVENESYIVTDVGCVGLGQHAILRDGRQVIVRDERGTIISVTELDGTTESEGCAWGFVVQVPESDFYSFSIPMVVEQVFPKAVVGENGGDVVIEVP
jgi:hypothetical protein